MRITKDHFGKKMVLPGWAGTGRYFIPSAITEVNNRVVGTTYIPGQESYTSWQSNDDHWADHNHWEYYTAEPASQESEAAGVGKPGYLTMDHIGKRVRRDKDGNALTLLGINLTGPHFHDGGGSLHTFCNGPRWDFVPDAASPLHFRDPGFVLTEDHIGKKVCLPTFGSSTNDELYFIPSFFSTSHAGPMVEGTTYMKDGAGWPDRWLNEAVWSLYEDRHEDVAAKFAEIGHPGTWGQTTPVPPAQPKDYSLLEAVRSGRRFRNVLNQKTSGDWIYVDEETDILHWCDSKLPFAMCEFNLTARYVLEPEPRKPVEVTEESFDAAWHKAATEQQNTDRPFRECLKEALGIVDTRT